MIYLSTCICTVVFVFYSFIFIKTYQLCGYDIWLFFKRSYSLNLSWGDKSKFVLTKRMIRFMSCLYILLFGLLFCVNYFVKNIWLIFLNYTILLFFLPFLLLFCHFLLIPVENLIKFVYFKKANKKLKKYQIIKIGITGSYGKTSTKNILKQLLEKEYKVCISPGNYNTPLGLTRTVLEELDDHDVLIAEMGAKHKGDIEVLTKMLNPDYGIITTIGPAHIEYFKNLKTIEETKYELAQNINKNGVLVFNGDNPSGRKLFSFFQGEKYLTCDEKGFAYARNIVVNPNGSTFEMVIDKKIFKCSTPLLGKCNIDNIVTASTLAYILKIKDEDIVAAIKTLKPVSHRLELIKSNQVVIIDDSYNSNMVGATQALEVLSMFEGNKIVVTPGFVEMGTRQSQDNFKLGSMIADVADFLIIMNETNKNDIFSGAISHNFDKNKILFANSRKEQKEILSIIASKDSVILFENDLPDSYK